jgi:hypothetical protein
VTLEKHRIKMEEIADLPKEESKGDLFKQVMASINPFSKYVIEEAEKGASDLGTLKEYSKSNWVLEKEIFQRPQVDQNLQKTSAEMYVTYKFYNNPFIKV